MNQRRVRARVRRNNLTHVSQQNDPSSDKLSDRGEMRVLTIGRDLWFIDNHVARFIPEQRLIQLQTVPIPLEKLLSTLKAEGFTFDESQLKKETNIPLEELGIQLKIDEASQTLRASPNVK